VDFADNIRRVREVLRRVDADNATSRVVSLKNASAKEIAAALQGLAGTGGGGQGGGVPGGGAGLSVVAVDSANSVIIRGDATSVARLAAIAAD
ncbi:hypothetical protein LXJ56_24775, partial [Escherichia coli]|nr:hypothetical protein [Escherichia coli]